MNTCAICNAPIPAERNRNGQARTCSAEHYVLHNKRMQAIRNLRNRNRNPEGIRYDSALALGFITQRLAHQQPGAFFGGART